MGFFVKVFFVYLIIKFIGSICKGIRSYIFFVVEGIMLNLIGCIRFNVKFVFWGFDVNCKFFVCDFKMGRNKGMGFIYGGVSFDVRVFFS